MVKSKKWYQNQIDALENAAKNVGSLMTELPYNASEKDLEDVMRENSPIQKECAQIYKKLNKLKDEYWMYYR